MRSLILVLCFWASTALGQSYPNYTSTMVNDFADVLNAQDEAALSRQLSTLENETGVEMTILTLPSRWPYAQGHSLEAFATGVFDHWGIGDKQRNDGVLILLLKDDREMRIELGAAYARDWDNAARRVVDDHFLPAFSADDFPRGLKEGTNATIDEIVTPFLDGKEPRSGSDGSDGWIVLLIGGVALLNFGRGMIGDFMARARSCPTCGRRGLRQSREVTTAASRTTPGSGTRTRRCLHCDYVDHHYYVIPQVTRSSGGFGGGRSGGGGASGRF